MHALGPSSLAALWARCKAVFAKSSDLAAVAVSGSYNDLTDKPSPSGTDADDFVVSHGTSGIWTWRKWDSGIAECWGRYTTSIACTTSYDPGYYNGTAVDVTFPFAFSAVPSVTGSANALANFALDSGNRTKTGVGFYCWRPGSGTVTEVSLAVKGKWK